MSYEWRKRQAGEPTPNYTDPEYFSIHWHANDWGNQTDLGFIDYCSTDKMSKLEIDQMGKELGLEGKKYILMWENPDDDDDAIEGCKIVISDGDTIEMANSVDHSRVLHLYACTEGGEKTTEVRKGNNEGSQHDEEGDLGGTDSESEFENPDYVLEDDSNSEEPRCNIGQTNLNSETVAAVDDDSEQSVYDDSDELRSCSDSYGELRSTPKPRWPVFNKGNSKFQVGMIFDTFKQFKEAIKMAAIKSRNQVLFGSNTREICRARCKKNCGWYIWAYLKLPEKNVVQIKSANFNHCCHKENKNRHITANFIAKHYQSSFRVDPSFSIANIMASVKRDFHVDIPTIKAWRGREVAMKLLHGDEVEQIRKLNSYGLEILKSNPGPTFKLDLENQVFKSMHVCMSAMKEGFATCRPLISLDGTWLKGCFGGQLLAAVGIDGNDCIYPLAWAVVQKENKDNWTWFLKLLAEDLGLVNGHHWTFISDRQKGLIPSIEELFPHSEHRFCVRHIYTNYKQMFQGVGMKGLIFAAAQSINVYMFERSMENIKKESLAGYEYLSKIPPKHWSRAYFRTNCKCDMILNNLCESFNSFILDARCKGVIALNETIVSKLMKRIQKKKKDSMKKVTTTYCPKVLKKLAINKENSSQFICEWSGGHLYKVIGSHSSYVVDKDERTCTCRKWQLSGIPCAHAVSAIWYHNEEPSLFIDPCYKVDLYLVTYNHLINPSPSEEFWPISNAPAVLPPVVSSKFKKKIGRPIIKRRLEHSEVKLSKIGARMTKKGVVMHCSLCKKSGHNKARCETNPECTIQRPKKQRSVQESSSERPEKLSVRKKGNMTANVEEGNMTASPQVFDVELGNDIGLGNEPSQELRAGVGQCHKAQVDMEQGYKAQVSQDGLSEVGLDALS